MLFSSPPVEKKSNLTSLEANMFQAYWSSDYPWYIIPCALRYDEMGIGWNEQLFAKVLAEELYRSSIIRIIIAESLVPVHTCCRFVQIRLSTAMYGQPVSNGFANLFDARCFAIIHRSFTRRFSSSLSKSGLFPLPRICNSAGTEF